MKKQRKNPPAGGKKRVYLNSEETLLVISNFAQSRLFDGQKALKKLCKKQQILVLAEQMGRKKRHTEQQNLTVDRIWTRNKPLSLLKVIPFIIKNNKINNVLVQFDFKTFGRKFETNFIVPLLLFFLKQSKKRVYFEFHQVIEEKKIRKNTPLKFKLQRKIFNLLLRLFYRSTARLTNNIIVFKPSLKQALSKFVAEDQIILLPSTLVIEQIKTSRKMEKNLDKTIYVYKKIVSTPYDISANVSLNLK